MDIEYKVEFSYEEFRGMLTKIGSFSIRKMRIARLVCIALWAVICLSILLNAFSHSMLDLAQLFYIVLALSRRDCHAGGDPEKASRPSPEDIGGNTAANNAARQCIGDA